MGDTGELASRGLSQQDSQLSSESPRLPKSPTTVSHDVANDDHKSQQQHSFEAQHAASANQPNDNSHVSGARQNPYNMAQLANALPAENFRQGQYQSGNQFRYQQNVPPTMVSQLHPMPQYSTQSSVGVANQTYYPQQQPMGQYYTGGQASPPSAPMNTRQNIQFYPTHLSMAHPQTGYYYQQSGQYHAQGAAMISPMSHGNYVSHGPGSAGPQGPSYPAEPSRSSYSLQSRHASSTTQDPNSARNTIVRGPPRKPRQSGHAIWIGNLPPQTDLMSLVYHVCKEAPGLESLFLISKSNCAFANFKDEETCASAQLKVHDSKFQGVRLVSRLRKSTVEGASGAAAPTGPASSMIATSTSQAESTGDTPSRGEPSHHSGLPADTGASSGTPSLGLPQQDKFFILKSLTVEDLDLSVRTGIWATQPHNEETLNNAFQIVDNVYLIFSANKSGEYFGYAKMISQIDQDPAAAIEFAPTSHTSSNIDLPQAIPTENTNDVPKGRIIDDSARGTIFWEADRDDSDGDSDIISDTSSHHEVNGEDGAKTWGKPFKLEWLSTNRLPFYKTRGLRNPWNSNREVKIARDGTELEPSVGRRLIGLFNRVQSPRQAPGVLPAHMAPLTGFPGAQPYGQ